MVPALSKRRVPKTPQKSTRLSAAEVCFGHRSIEYYRDPRQHLTHNRVRNAFQLFAAAGGEIESAGLIASNDPRRFGSDCRQGHDETGHAREIAAARN
ncbi:MAG: hypothetical protein WB562_20500, partial [Candidatus Sulfotelmatobacter sp.]